MQNHKVCVCSLVCWLVLSPNTVHVFMHRHIPESLHFTYFAQFTAGWHCNICFYFQFCVALRSPMYLYMCLCMHYTQVTCVVFNVFLCLQNCGSQAPCPHWHTGWWHISNLLVSHTNPFVKCVLLFSVYV